MTKGALFINVYRVIRYNLPEKALNFRDKGQI